MLSLRLQLLLFLLLFLLQLLLLLLLLLLRCIPSKYEFCLCSSNNEAAQQHLEISKGSRHEELKHSCGSLLLLLLLLLQLLLLLAIAAGRYWADYVCIEMLHQRLLPQKLKRSSKHSFILF